MTDLDLMTNPNCTVCYGIGSAKITLKGLAIRRSAATAVPVCLANAIPVKNLTSVK